MPKFTDEDRLKRMVERVGIIASEVADLLLHDHIFWAVQKIVGENETLASTSSHFFQWMGEAFVESASAAIRRQLDNDAHAISLRSLLEELIKYPHLVTRAYYLGVSTDGSALSVELNNDAFDKWSTAENRGQLDQDMVERDLLSLTSISEKIKHYCDRRVAHYDKRGVTPLDIPTFQDLEDSLREIERLVVRYNLILTGTFIGGLLPTIDYPWDKIFDIPWRTLTIRNGE